MKRPQSENQFGSDSFLDVVSNIVGILIILVMVVSVRVGNVSLDLPSVEPPPIDPQVAVKAQQAQEDDAALTAENAELVQQLEMLRKMNALREQERNIAAIVARKMEMDEEIRRQSLSAEENRLSDLRREVISLTAVRHDLRQKADVKKEAPPEQTVTIETYPTPIGRSVHGHEIHFQIKGNKVVFIPIEQFVNLLKKNIQETFRRMGSRNEIVETLGPIGGFRFKYTVGREEVAVSQYFDRNQPKVVMGNSVSFQSFVLIPVSGTMGEDIDRVFDPDSDFMRIIQSSDPKRSTVTLWTYDDSFPAFRRLRKDLYERGFPVAGRPMPMGEPISGSPHGHRSVAE